MATPGGLVTQALKQEEAAWKTGQSTARFPFKWNRGWLNIKEWSDSIHPTFLGQIFLLRLIRLGQEKIFSKFSKSW